MKFPELYLDDIIIFENRFYRVVKKPYNRNNQQQGLRVMLVLVRETELSLLLKESISEKEVK